MELATQQEQVAATGENQQTANSQTGRPIHRAVGQVGGAGVVSGRHWQTAASGHGTDSSPLSGMAGR